MPNSIVERLTIRQSSSQIRRCPTNVPEDLYDAWPPAAVDAVALMEASDDHTIDDIYGDLGDWSTAREERQRYERARQHRSRVEGETVSG